MTTRPGLRLLQAGLLAALTTLAGIGLMSTSGWLIARAAEHPEASALTLAAVCVRALGLGRGVLRYGERLIGHDAVLRWVADRRVDVFDQLRRQPAGVRTGDALSALGRDVEGLQDLWLRGVLPWASATAVAAAASAAAVLVLPSAGVLLAAGLGVAVLLVPSLALASGTAAEQLVAARAAHQTAVTDLLHGCADLVTTKGTAGALDAADAASAELDRLAGSAAVRVSALSGLAVLVQGLTTAGVAWTGWQAVRAGDLTRVWLVVLVLGAYAAFEPAAGLVDAVNAVRTGRRAVQRISALDGTKPVSELRLSPEPSSTASVVARGLGLLRPGRTVPALRGVDLDVSAGRAVAVVGGSGAGKTTLLQLLAGQLSPTFGSAWVGGVAPDRLTQEARPQAVVLVEQDAHVFDASVRDNLRLGRPDAHDRDLHEVLGVVGLTDWLEQLPEGLDTVLGHRGSRLSGGQRRRLTVARGLLSPAAVLLLDEPTEGLAPDEADRLVDDVLTAASGRAVLLVTHRLDVLDRVDEVLVLEHGEVALQGTPDEVRAAPGLVRDAWEAFGTSLGDLRPARR